MGSAAVVVEAKGVELGLQFGQGASWGLLAEVALEGLVETFYLPAGLGVVRGGVLDPDPEPFQLQFQEHLAAAGLGGEDGSVVAEQRGGQAELVGSGVEAVNHIAGLNGEEGGGGEVEAGVVVQEVEDLDRGVVLQLPGGGIDLPRLVG